MSGANALPEFPRGGPEPISMSLQPELELAISTVMLNIFWFVISTMRVLLRILWDVKIMTAEPNEKIYSA
jgi:hypothetical protein